VATSAAVQVVVARALLAANAVSFPSHDLMQLICANERAVTGAPVGVLDPAVILEGREGELVVVDAADGSCKKHRFSRRFPKHEWALVDVGVPRVLGETPYAARVEECRRAAEFLGSTSGRLGELSLPALRKRRGAMSPELVKRAEHYFGEVRRVRLAISAAAEGDLAAFAAIMNASADSLTQLFEVGVPETVRALAHLREVPRVLAVTYAGGGFGGHLLCLVEAGGTGALGLAASERGMQARAIHPL
jgi:galactokinase